MAEPRAEVIVPNFNDAAHLRACLSSLLEQDFHDYRVTVVDDASSDGSVELVREHFPQVNLIAKERNTGFTGACNAGLRWALSGSAEYFVLVNSDTEAAPDWLSELIAAAGADAAIGLCQSLIYLAGGEQRINSAGNEAHFLGYGYCGNLGEVDDGRWRSTRDVPYASGGSLLIRREALEQIGLLDEDYFLYHDDIDLSWRARLAGWRVVMAPRSHIYHDYSFSRNRYKFYYLERNRLVMMLKNYEWRTVAVLMPALIGAEIAMLGYSLSDGWLRDKLRGYAYVARNLGHIMEKRRRVQRTRKQSDRVMLEYLTARISFPELENEILTRLANPVSEAYWKLARRLI